MPLTTMLFGTGFGAVRRVELIDFHLESRGWNVCVFAATCLFKRRKIFFSFILTHTLLSSLAVSEIKRIAFRMDT